MMDDLISRRDAINVVSDITTTMSVYTNKDECYGMKRMQKQAITELENLPSAESEAISKWKKEFREYVDSLDIARDDWKGIIEHIDELPSAEQEAPDINVGNIDTTTHDSIPAETGKNDGDRTSGDCISRQQAIYVASGYCHPANIATELAKLPSVQPDIIRCKDCEYLCNEDGLRGMCWNINGFGTDVKDKYNSFCSWAERREDE